MMCHLKSLLREMQNVREPNGKKFILTGLDDEAYRAASDAGMENAKGNETTILYEVEGVACMVKNIMGSTMMYLTLADA